MAITTGSQSLIEPHPRRPDRSTTADHIKDCILTHSLKLGDRLPTESELCQLVSAFWDAHAPVLPCLDVSLPADLVQTARPHVEILQAAEDGDAQALIPSVDDHYEPILRALDSTRLQPATQNSTTVDA